MKKTYLWVILLLIMPACDMGGNVEEAKIEPHQKAISTGWASLSAGRKGKIVYAQPPKMIILDLTTGLKREVPNIITDGAPGRRKRGKSPRPSWSRDGKYFVYRYDGKIFVSDEAGHYRNIFNKQMDCSHETRWTFFHQAGIDYIAGPSVSGNVILVNAADPGMVKIAYSGGDVEKHCEITGTGKYVVYDNDSDICVAPFGTGRGITISGGQSCRPCASPDNRVAWLPSPHTRYRIHDAVRGAFLKDLPAPKNQEIYRMNWSNLPDFAVHMYGSRGNTRIHVRKISTGEALFVCYGWDPDLFVGL